MKLNNYDNQILGNIYILLEISHRIDLSKELKRIIRKIKKENENFMYALHAKKTVQQKIDISKKNQKK